MQELVIFKNLPLEFLSLSWVIVSVIEKYCLPLIFYNFNKYSFKASDISTYFVLNLCALLLLD